MSHRHTLLILSLLVALTAAAQQFDRHFDGRTLRLDYIFAGDTARQHIALDRMSVLPGWYGKRARLAELPVEGNGQITVRSAQTGDTLYRNSFSTLFQEWLTYPEAATTQRSFENVFLVPMPRETVDITVDLRDNRRRVVTTMTHRVDPTDILIAHKGEQAAAPVVTLQQAADTTRCIHIAYVAEGYRADEMDTFLSDARAATEAIFAHEPFRSTRQRFNIVAVESPSQDSDVSHPAQGVWRNTALSSHFDTFYSSRYLTTLRLSTLHDWLAGVPYEHIIVLVNSSTYGGGGILNSYNLTTCHQRHFLPVVVHEFGHSFAGLADEYAYDNEPLPMYPHDVEPWEQNITTRVDFASKWADMVAPGTPLPTPLSTDTLTATRRVGLFEGAGYSLNGVYRPVQDCRMRVNDVPDFCPVCQRALKRIIDFYTED